MKEELTRLSRQLPSDTGTLRKTAGALTISLAAAFNAAPG
jgi:hypothetical protein